MRLDVASRGSAGRQPGTGDGSSKSRNRQVWKRQRAGIFSSLRLAVSRFARGWHLLLAVALGMLVAVVLICTVPLYDALVSDLQLQHTINANGPVARNIEITAQSGAISPDLRTKSTALVQGLASRYASSFTGSESTYYAVTDHMALKQAGQHSFDITSIESPQLEFLATDFAAVAPHLRFLAGGLARATGSSVPVDITEQMAKDNGLAVGSHLVVTQYGGTVFGAKEIDLTLTIAGIFTPKDASDPYWNGLTFDAGGTPTTPKIYPIVISPDIFYSQLPTFTQVGMTQHWVYYTRPEAISTSNMSRVRDDIAQIRAHINGDLLSTPGIARVGVESMLDSTINDVQAQAALLTLPLYVVVAQIVGLALLFVAAMAGLLVEAQAQDIATLKSRGASGTQILGAFTVQGLFLALIAAVAGPFLAALLAVALLKWFVASDILLTSGVTSNYFTAVASPAAVAIPAIVGALLGVGAVSFAAFQSARLDVLAFRREQGRSARPPFWRRYYLDVALAVLCGVGYIELGQFGGVNTRQQLGNASASPLLLVTPALLLLAGALLVLRLFPLGASLGARFASRGRGLTSLLAFSQVERNPQRYSRITLLLVLAVGLGLFALTFDTSLQRNAQDRATYTVGSDVRVQQSFGEGNGRGTQLAGEMAKLPGVLGVTPVYRTTAATTSDQGDIQADLLGIDPATWQQDAGVISWRSDYASQPMSALLSGMQAHADTPQSAGTAAAPIWTLASDTFAAQFHLSAGDQFTLQLSELTSGATVFVVGAVVHEFPTLYPSRLQGGFLVVNENDLFTAVRLQSPNQDTSLDGPNEFWLRTTQNPTQQAALLNNLGPDAGLDVNKVTTLSDMLTQNAGNPVGAGMRGLLIVGAVTAAVLAVLGSIIQSLLATRRRATQFAVLRTVGMAGRQLTGLLLGEQIVVYVFGLIGGTVLGLLLASATLPFLQFSDTTIDPARLGIPSYVLAFNLRGTAIFYAALLIAFLLALAIAARFATTIGLGKALRLGED
ncbi:MAG TPA: FtsX-like permease family protein [Ktedonobacterales bacterium]|nr:FtsX-like permease family protein [Ktedonobacterales bacterium]